MNDKKIEQIIENKIQLKLRQMITEEIEKILEARAKKKKRGSFLDKIIKK